MKDLRRAWIILGVNGVLLVLAVFLVAVPWYLTRPAQVPHAPATPVASLTADPFVSPR